MTPQDEREAIARAIAPGAWSLHGTMPKLRVADPFHAADLDMSLAAADRVLALRQPGAEYRLDERAFVSAMDERLKTAYRQNGGIAAIARRAHGAMLIRNIAILEAIEVIRLLPESTKGEGRGE